MILHRAEATRKHSGRATKWKGEVRPDMRKTVEQAQRWQMKEPTADIYVVSDNGRRATLEQMQEAHSNGKPTSTPHS